MVMTSIPARETLTVEFKSDPPAGLSDKTVVESVVGMTNAQGGVLYIGVDDDGGAGGVRSPKWSDPEKVTVFLAGQTVPPVVVRAETLYAENGLPVTAVYVPAGRGLTATKDGRVIQRRMKIDKTPENVPVYPQEYATVLSDQGLWDFTDRVLPEAALEDLDPIERVRLRRLMETFRAEAALTELDDDELDKALGLVKQTPQGYRPTVAGLLLIGREKRLRRLLPTNGAVFQVMSGTDVIVNDDIALPLLGTFEEMLLRFRARNGEREFAEGLVRVPVPDFSERAFREALVNAFVHRDYSVLGAVSVRMTDEDISVTSPGGFVRGVSLENLLVVEPRGRNPLLAGIFKRIGLAEKTGRGIDRIFEGAALYGRPWPDYSESTEAFVRVRVQRAVPDIAFYKRVLAYKKRFSRSPSTAALLIMSALEDAPGAGEAELSRRTGFSEMRISGQIRTLLHEEVIEAMGEGYRLLNLNPAASSSGKSTGFVGMPDESGDRVADLLRLAAEKRVVRREDVVEALGMTPQQAYRLLRKLSDEGLLVRSGTRRTTVYALPASEDPR